MLLKVQEITVEKAVTSVRVTSDEQGVSAISYTARAWAEC